MPKRWKMSPLVQTSKPAIAQGQHGNSLTRRHGRCCTWLLHTCPMLVLPPSVPPSLPPSVSVCLCIASGTYSVSCFLPGPVHARNGAVRPVRGPATKKACAKPSIPSTSSQVPWCISGKNVDGHMTWEKCCTCMYILKRVFLARRPCTCN